MTEIEKKKFIRYCRAFRHYITKIKEETILANGEKKLKKKKKIKKKLKKFYSHAKIINLPNPIL